MRRADGPPTFLRRQGHVTRAQRRALRLHWPRLGVDLRFGEPLDLVEAFGRRAPVGLEIGFGMGGHLVDTGGARPDWNLLGVEVHRPGLGATLAALTARAVDNVRLLRGDARVVLADHLRPDALDAAWILFPEPWPRSPGRRLVDASLVALLATRLRAGATVHLATDDADYAAAMRAAFAGARAFAPVDAAPGRAPTGYEQRAHDAGRAVTDLVYTRVEADRA